MEPKKNIWEDDHPLAKHLGLLASIGAGLGALLGYAYAGIGGAVLGGVLGAILGGYIALMFIQIVAGIVFAAGTTVVVLAVIAAIVGAIWFVIHYWGERSL